MLETAEGNSLDSGCECVPTNTRYQNTHTAQCDKLCFCTAHTLSEDRRCCYTVMCCILTVGTLLPPARLPYVPCGVCEERAVLAVSPSH